jgi:hypothetical protein
VSIISAILFRLSMSPVSDLLKSTVSPVMKGKGKGHPRTGHEGPEGE